MDLMRTPRVLLMVLRSVCLGSVEAIRVEGGGVAGPLVMAVAQVQALVRPLSKSSKTMSRRGTTYLTSV